MACGAIVSQRGGLNDVAKRQSHTQRHNRIKITALFSRYWRRKDDDDDCVTVGRDGKAKGRGRNV